MARDDFFQWVQYTLTKPFPLIYFMRWGIVIAVILRFLITSSEQSDINHTLWLLTLTGLFVYSLIITISVLIKPELHAERWWLSLQVLLDTVFFTTLFLLTQKPDSDIYLVLMLPLLIVADNFNSKEAIQLFGIISLAFIFSAIYLTVSTESPMPLLEIIIRDLLPRTAFFFFFLFLAFIRGRLLREQTEELEAVRLTAVKIAERNMALESRLDAIISASVDLLHAKGCKVYLQVQDQEVLELVAIKGIGSEKISPGYIMPFGSGVSGQVIKNRSPLIVEDYSQFPYRVPELVNLFSAVVAVPLFLDDKAIGVLAVFDDAKNRKFNQRDKETLERLAQHAAVAIHNMQLAEIAKRQSKALQALISAGNAMNSNLDIIKTIHSIAEQAWKLAIVYNQKPPLYTCVGVLDESARYIEFRAAYPQKHLADLQARVGQIDLNHRPYGIVGRTVKSQSAQLVTNITEDIDYIDYNSDTCTQLSVPINGRTHTIGIINIEHADFNAFPLDLKKNAEVLATQAAAAIENANLFEQADSQRKQTEDFYKASVTISSARDQKEVSQKILQTLHDLIPFNRATLQLFSGDKRELVDSYNLEEDQVDLWLLRPISEDKLIKAIIESKEICILASTKENPYWEPVASTMDIESWIGIPLVYQGNVVGLITIDHVQKTNYSDEVKKILGLFANHAAIQLQNAILHLKNQELLNNLHERVFELSETKEYLETILSHLEDHRNLALIGLVYGESIHFARNKLGMAKAKADSIAVGHYGKAPKDVEDNARKIMDYINDYLHILDETQKEALQSPEPILLNIHDVLDNVIESKIISRHIEVRKLYRATQPAIHAPEVQLRQVFLVIVENALDAMKSERVGTLELKTKMLTDEIDERFIEISISDTGKGIPKSKQANLFRPKSRDKPSYKRRGTGLGLVWAYSFLRTYSGDIEYQTKRGKGTTIYLRIPLDFREKSKI